MKRQLQSGGYSGGNEITKPDALLVVDSTGSYYAGERLSDREVEQLRCTHKVSEILFGGKPAAYCSTQALKIEMR